MADKVTTTKTDTVRRRRHKIPMCKDVCFNGIPINGSVNNSKEFLRLLLAESTMTEYVLIPHVNITDQGRSFCMVNRFVVSRAPDLNSLLNVAVT